MGRKKARKGLVFVVYQKQFQDDNFSVDTYLDNYSYDKAEKEFIKQGFQLIEENIDTIDKYISDNLINWTISRLYRLDLSILRVALYELLIDGKTPTPIVANEAVEIAKKYGTEDSSRLVNGILGTIIRSENL